MPAKWSILEWKFAHLVILHVREVTGTNYSINTLGLCIFVVRVTPL